jgi:uncharacterized OsmC-like protein
VTGSDVRRYGVEARSTDTFGRVLVSARDQHFVVDGPVQNGCPGEAVTPAEIFLAGVAACGVELLAVVARADHIPLGAVRVSIDGVLDRAHPVRSDATVFNSVHLSFELGGVDESEAAVLVAAFKKR